MQLPVTRFPDTASLVVKGLKARFAEFGEEFATTRVSVLKDTENKAEFEVVVRATGGQPSSSSTIKRVQISLLVFAPDYGSANRLAAMTAEFIQSLPAIQGSVSWAEVSNDGEHIENPGPQQCRNIIGQVVVKAAQTIIYER